MNEEATSLNNHNMTLALLHRESLLKQEFKKAQQKAKESMAKERQERHDVENAREERKLREFERANGLPVWRKNRLIENLKVKPGQKPTQEQVIAAEHLREQVKEDARHINAVVDKVISAAPKKKVQKILDAAPKKHPMKKKVPEDP